MIHGHAPVLLLTIMCRMPDTAVMDSLHKVLQLHVFPQSSHVLCQRKYSQQGGNAQQRQAQGSRQLMQRAMGPASGAIQQQCQGRHLQQQKEWYREHAAACHLSPAKLSGSLQDM